MMASVGERAILTVPVGNFETKHDVTGNCIIEFTVRHGLVTQSLPLERSSRSCGCGQSFETALNDFDGELSHWMRTAYPGSAFTAKGRSGQPLGLSFSVSITWTDGRDLTGKTGCATTCKTGANHHSVPGVQVVGMSKVAENSSSQRKRKT